MKEAFRQLMRAVPIRIQLHDMLAQGTQAFEPPFGETHMASIDIAWVNNAVYAMTG